MFIMILQRWIAVGLVLGVKVSADKAQHPISIKTSDDCHNAARQSRIHVDDVTANKILVYRIGIYDGRDGFLQLHPRRHR